MNPRLNLRRKRPSHTTLTFNWFVESVFWRAYKANIITANISSIYLVRYLRNTWPCHTFASLLQYTWKSYLTWSLSLLSYNFSFRKFSDKHCPYVAFCQLHLFVKWVQRKQMTNGSKSCRLRPTTLRVKRAPRE